MDKSAGGKILKQKRQKRQRWIVIIVAAALTSLLVLGGSFVVLMPASPPSQDDSPEIIVNADEIEEILPKGDLVAEGNYTAYGGLTPLFDGVGRVDPLYIHAPTDLWINIPPSAVTHLKIYNQYYDHYESTKTLEGIKVLLCEDETSCQVTCDAPVQMKPKDWEVFYGTWMLSNCTEITETRHILISLPAPPRDDFIFTISEIDILGKFLVGNAVRRVSVRRGQFVLEDGRIHREFRDFEQVLDGVRSTNPADCFAVKKHLKGVVSFDIPWSSVTHISILSSQHSDTVIGTFVDVCSHGRHCLPCGVVQKTDPGKFSDVYCLGGWITGNQIQISRSIGTLNFCEVEVFGISQANTTGAITMIDIITEGDQESAMVRTDGKWETYSCCTPTAEDENLFYEFTFPRALISHVNLLVSAQTKFSGEPVPALNGTVIEVCRVDEEVFTEYLDWTLVCNLCGSVSTNQRAVWTTVLCPYSEEMRGTTLKVTPPWSDSLCLCEIEVFARHSATKH